MRTNIALFALIALVSCERKPAVKRTAVQMIECGSPCTSQKVQSIHDDANTNDGATIHIPAGTHHWNSLLTISKGVTLQGDTTFSVTPPDPKAAANDETIILDDNTDTHRSLIAMKVPAGKIAHLTRLTFGKGTAPDGFSETGLIRIDSP